MTEPRNTRIETDRDAGLAFVTGHSAQSKIQNPKSKMEADDFSDMPADMRREMEVASKSRRDFMKVTGMAAMGAVIAGCTADDRHVKPLLQRTEGVTPGVVYHYASTCQGCSSNCGILMSVRDGRPIKLEGNDRNPLNSGGLCAVGQAQLWTLYNPDRMHAPANKDGEVDWKTLDAAAFAAIKAGGAVLLTGTVSGACANNVIAKFVAKGGRHVSYDAVSRFAIAKAHEATHGTRVIPHYKFNQATVVVSFDGDFLATWLSPTEHARDWASQRDLKFGKTSMSRLICFEARMSLTGANADERFRVRDGERGALLTDIANRLGGSFGAPGKHSVDPAAMVRIADELKAAGKRGLVVSGSRDVREQKLVNYINDKIGAYGTTLDLTTPSQQKLGNDDDVAALLKDMEASRVKTLIIWGVNPVYDLADGAKFKEALGKVTNTIAIALRADETAGECQWIAAEDDGLESWGDFQPVKGLHSLSQPGVRRLWNTRTGLTSILKWIGDADGSRDYRDVLKAYWEANVLAGMSWTQAVETGFIDRRSGGAQPVFTAGGMGDVGGVATVTEAKGLEIVTYEPINLRDGKQAGNGWLQEMADPMVRVAWTNLALMSPATLEAEGVAEGDIVEVTADVDGRKVSCKVPVGRQPGQADGTVAIALGYGRTKAGPIVHGRGVEEDAVDPDLLEEGVHKIGDNAFPFVSARAASGSISKTGASIPLAKISEHDSQEGRPILKQTSHDEWKHHKNAGNDQELPSKSLTLWPTWEYKGHKWGMTIDLNACIGCGACQVACSIENNVPIVGKQEVWRRREMHWIRIDAYYEDNDGKKLDGDRTNDENPEVGFQPIMCQHCANAPCETVCPVIATSHTDEGLNAQAYNRCIGTRYCANNCPYKVRRFNWFRYEHHNLTMNLVLNPDVVVRSRGVMEKCSMCAQRIYEGKRNAALAGTKVEDGSINTACAQTCPTDAIVFGDRNDKESAIARLAKDPRNYQVLAELNTDPTVTYLTKVRNRPAKATELKRHDDGHAGHDHD
jgi:Fe-S-cluster-containing dehydrogenase component